MVLPMNGCAGVDSYSFVCLSPAVAYRQGSLLLQNVVLKDCSHQAIVLLGPGASLTARGVTFSGHGSSSNTQQGIVISAQQASVTMEDVVITGSSGMLPHGTPAHSPSCNSTHVQQPLSRAGAVCGAPILSSSLIHLQDSTFKAVNSSIDASTAGALISTSGSAQHSMQLLQGTQLQDNTAAWLVVADSFAADEVGRENLLAPHPSEQNAQQKLRFKPVYTTFDFLWHMKNMKEWRKELPANLARPKLQRYVGVAPQGQVRPPVSAGGRPGLEAAESKEQ